MSNNVVGWPARGPFYVASDGELAFQVDLQARLDGLLALIQAIEDSEILAVIPDSEVGGMQLKAMLSLLKLAEREVLELTRVLA